MHRTKRWNVFPPHDKAAELAARLKVSPLVAQLAEERQLTREDLDELEALVRSLKK